MAIILLISAVVLLLSAVLHRLAWKIGIPVLLAFILLGMAFGTDGVFRIPFDNFALSEQICTVALIFIMFYGGFGTSWKQARPVAGKAILLSSLGVVLTAALTGLFCYFALGMAFWEGMLMGAVIGSTDAASVFSILRSRRLGLKYSTDSLLELESGSNDPCSYMLTIMILSVLGGTADAPTVAGLAFSQIIFGLGIGAALALISVWILRRVSFASPEVGMAFMVGIAILSYALPNFIGGNGYLSAYLVGIVLGNAKIQNKQELVHFFDGLTGLMQTLIFFLLGLLATPSRMPAVLLPALFIALFLTFVARPAAVFAILSPFRCGLQQKLLVSFAGLRGAASIVFAILASMSGTLLSGDLFHMVFCIVLFSILVQGSLLSLVAKKLQMTDESIDIRKTFTDYSEEKDFSFIQFVIPKGHHWQGKTLRDIILPEEMLVVLVLRGEEHILPSGETKLIVGDIVVLCASAFQETGPFHLTERPILPGSEWGGKNIAEYSPNADELVVLIKRNGRILIPRGDTRIKTEDVLVIGENCSIR